MLAAAAGLVAETLEQGVFPLIVAVAVLADILAMAVKGGCIAWAMEQRELHVVVLVAAEGEGRPQLFVSAVCHIQLILEGAVEAVLGFWAKEPLALEAWHKPTGADLGVAQDRGEQVGRKQYKGEPMEEAEAQEADVFVM